MRPVSRPHVVKSSVGFTPTRVAVTITADGIATAGRNHGDRAPETAPTQFRRKLKTVHWMTIVETNMYAFRDSIQRAEEAVRERFCRDGDATGRVSCGTCRRTFADVQSLWRHVWLRRDAGHGGHACPWPRCRRVFVDRSMRDTRCAQHPAEDRPEEPDFPAPLTCELCGVTPRSTGTRRHGTRTPWPQRAACAVRFTGTAWASCTTWCVSTGRAPRPTSGCRAAEPRRTETGRRRRRRRIGPRGTSAHRGRARSVSTSRTRAQRPPLCWCFPASRLSRLASADDRTRGAGLCGGGRWPRRLGCPAC